MDVLKDEKGTLIINYVDTRLMYRRTNLAYSFLI
jgi:hypothetical protein